MLVVVNDFDDMNKALRICVLQWHNIGYLPYMVQMSGAYFNILNASHSGSLNPCDSEGKHGRVNTL